MPALCVSVNGQHLATVAFDDNTMIAVNLFGSRSHEEFAVLDMHGGRYGEGQPRHLIWIAERRLEPGQVVEVALVPDAPTSHEGKTIDELYPANGVAESEETDFTMTDAIFEALSARPMLRDGYEFKLAPSASAEVSGRTEGAEVSFSLSVMWNDQHRPDNARYSLGTNTLDNMRTRSLARSHAKNWLQIGDTLRFQLWAAAGA